MQIKTERLILRDLTKKDISNIQKYANNVNISKFIPVIPYPYSKKDAVRFVNHCIKEAKKKPRQNYEFCINLKPDTKAIGMISITKVDRFNETCTVGYWLGEEYWRRGIVNEALKEIINFVFKRLKLRRINIQAFADNDASNALIKKMGFIHEGTTRKSHKDKATKTIHDHYEYGMLKEEWLKNKPNPNL